MWPFTINYISGVPIYVQVKEAIRNAVITGAYPPGTQLPTVRQMAVKLKINANTVSRAYSELEREGVISGQQGRGTFVTMMKSIDYDKLAQLEKLVAKMITDAKELGFDEHDILAVFDRIRHSHGHSGEEVQL